MSNFIGWEDFYDADEAIEVPDWIDDDETARRMEDDIRWERAHERAIEIGLLTALHAADHRWSSYGTEDYVPEILRRLIAEHFPRPQQTASGKTRPSITAARRRTVMERDAYRCQRCGDHHNLVIDHIHPLARGGTNDIDNLQVLCHDCNTEKGTKTMDELGWVKA